MGRKSLRCGPAASASRALPCRLWRQESWSASSLSRSMRESLPVPKSDTVAPSRLHCRGRCPPSGTMYVFTGGTTVVTQFDRLRVGLSQTPQEIALPQRDPSEMSVQELRLYIRVLQRSGEKVARYVARVHFKLAVPLSAALFALLAVPVGLRPHRSGTSIGLGLTFLVLIGYYIISAAALPLGENGRLNPVVAGWLPDLVLAVVGVALLQRVDQ